MTKLSMNLADLLEKHDDGNFLRAIAEAVLQLIMETDVVGVIGAGRNGWKIRDPVVCTCRSERPQWRTFDLCSISQSATSAEVFRSIPRKISPQQCLRGHSPNPRSHQVQRISARRDHFGASWRRGQCSAPRA